MEKTDKIIAIILFIIIVVSVFILSFYTPVHTTESSNIHIVSYNGSLVQCINLTIEELCYIEVLRDGKND